MSITQAQYAEILARTSRNVVRQPQGEPVERESDLHDQIKEECRRRGWICLHGSMAHRSHRTIGEPDFIIIASEGRVFFLEAKRKNAKPRPEQIAMIAWLKSLGAEAHLVYSMRDVHKVIDKPKAY